jgi:hypothetical protein
MVGSRVYERSRIENAPLSVSATQRGAAASQCLRSSLEAKD